MIRGKGVVIKVWCTYSSVSVVFHGSMSVVFHGSVSVVFHGSVMSNYGCMVLLGGKIMYSNRF